MKLKYLLITIISMLIFCSKTEAQTPGFGGRKVSVFYDQSLSFHFRFLGESVPMNTADKKNNLFNRRFATHKNLELELAISRNIAVGFNYFNFRTGYSGTSLFLERERVFSRNVIQNGFGIYARFYRVSLNGYSSDEGALAPLGFYISPHLMLSNDIYETNGNKSFYNGDRINIATTKSTHLGLNIKVGRHIPLFDKFMLDVGAGFGGFIPNKVDKERGKLDIYKDPYFSIAFHHMLTAHIGIGYAIF